MAYKVSVIVLMVTLVFLTLKYWRAKEEKDNCYINLDRHIKFIKENEKDSKQSKDTFEKLVHSRETEIADIKKDKSSAESKLKLCESSGTSKDKEIRTMEASLADKDAALSDKNKDLDEMIEKYGRLKNEYDKVVANEKKLRGEIDLLETHLSNRKDEIETLEDKVKDAVIQAKDDALRLDAALSAKKEVPKDKSKVLDKDKAINKVADPIKKPADIEDDDEGINRKNIDDDVDKKDKVLSEKHKNDLEEEEDEN
eukprot:TRINITY_DN9291_c0_g1_i10.p1 TRINITY_DN9291_c0_g1~~TRINITY_DN9291_c0_g1_i10.p1  ORF type:complete len:255 (-),score=103.52 TRINITY_DN9291_c0_g1_i10:285-1049(-)